MRKIRPQQVTVAVTKDIRAAFDQFEIKGQGGFQSLCREITERVAKESVVRFKPEEFKRIVTYATTYGEGGFQARLRLLVASWANQHFNELVS